MGFTDRRGRRGERVAARALRRRGWTIVATRWRGGGGELDLVAARGGVLAICEVKTRSDPRALDEPLTATQRARMRRAATAFLARRPDLARGEVQLDLITVHLRGPLSRMRHHPHGADGG
jgi:putative endonuclease